MEIGGTDLIVECVLSKQDAACTVRAWTPHWWPDAVFEGVEGEEPDMFIYENAEAKRLWDIDVPEGEANMVYALFGDKQVTLVYDKGTRSQYLARNLALHLMKMDIMAKNPGCPTCCIPINKE